MLTIAFQVRNVLDDDGWPTEVQVIDMPDHEAVAAYTADPERAALLEMRDRAIARTEILGVEPVG